MSLNQYFIDLKGTHGAPELILVSDHAPSPASPVTRRRTDNSNNRINLSSYGPPSVPARQDSREGINELYIFQQQQQQQQQHKQHQQQSRRPHPSMTTTTSSSDKALETFYEGVAPKTSNLMVRPRPPKKRSHSFSGKNDRWARFMGLPEYSSSSSSSSSSQRRGLVLKGMFADALVDPEMEDRYTTTTTTTTTTATARSTTTTTTQQQQQQDRMTNTQRIVSDCLAEAEQVLGDEIRPVLCCVKSRRNSFHVMRDARWNPNKPLVKGQTNQALIRGISA